MFILTKLIVNVKFFRHILQQSADRQMLGANLLTFSAFHAIRCLASVRGLVLVIKSCTPPLEKFFHIHAGKQIRNGDLLGTACCTITAGRAGDQRHPWSFTLFLNFIVKRKYCNIFFFTASLNLLLLHHALLLGIVSCSIDLDLLKFFIKCPQFFRRKFHICPTNIFFQPV